MEVALLNLMSNLFICCLIAINLRIHLHYSNIILIMRIIFDSLSMCYGNFCVPSHNSNVNDAGFIEQLQQYEHIENVSKTDVTCKQYQCIEHVRYKIYISQFNWH